MRSQRRKLQSFKESVDFGVALVKGDAIIVPDGEDRGGLDGSDEGSGACVAGLRLLIYRVGREVV